MEKLPLAGMAFNCILSGIAKEPLEILLEECQNKICVKKSKWMLNKNRMGNGKQVDSEKQEIVPVDWARECGSDGN